MSVVIANTTRGESVLSEFTDLINESGIQVFDLKEPQKVRDTVMKALKNGEKMEKILSIIEHPTLYIKIKNIFKRLYNEKNKILIVNNYSMKDSLKLVNDGILPKHHAWGIDKLDKCFDLKFAHYKCPNILIKIHLLDYIISIFK